MITKRKLEIYQKYQGDIDIFARIGTCDEKQIASEEDWMIIDDIIFCIKLENKGLLSVVMKNKMKKNIEDNIEDKYTQDFLFSSVLKSCI